MSEKPENPAAIAAGLTMGHRSVLQSVEPTADGRVLVPSMLGNLNHSVGWPQGLVSYYSAYYSRLTSVGLAVREYLLAQRHKEQSS